MSAGVGIAIFVKTPGHSPIKTRLAAGIGRDAAEAFHRRSAAAVAEVAMQVGDGATAYWAVAEPAAMAAPAWRDLPRIAQGEGDLGARMARVYEALRARHGRAVLIGADAPQLVAGDLRSAAALLDTHDAVLGPSADGGFWLFGGRDALPDAAWRDTPWSHPETARRFADALDGRSLRRLRTLRDVDAAEDLPPLAAALRALTAPTPAQRALRDWLGALGIDGRRAAS